MVIFISNQNWQLDESDSLECVGSNFRVLERLLSGGRGPDDLVGDEAVVLEDRRQGLRLQALHLELEVGQPLAQEHHLVERREVTPKVQYRLLFVGYLCRQNISSSLSLYSA